jgi:hypothetical protein
MEHQTPPTVKEIRKGWEAYSKTDSGKLDTLLIPEIHERIQKNGYLTPLDLYAIVCWKTYSTVSAENAVVENSQNEIKRVTENASAELKMGNVKGAMDTLDKLAQIGPRLASAVFTFYDPEKYGTMDHHAFRSLGWSIDEKDFNSENYERYLSWLGDYKTKLNATLSCHEIDASLFMLDK